MFYLLLEDDDEVLFYGRCVFFPK